MEMRKYFKLNYIKSIVIVTVKIVLRERFIDLDTLEREMLKINELSKKI